MPYHMIEKAYKFRSTQTEFGQLEEYVGIAPLPERMIRSPAKYPSGIVLPDYAEDVSSTERSCLAQRGRAWVIFTRVVLCLFSVAGPPHETCSSGACHAPPKTGSLFTQ
jgi:hypothetical protein